MTLLLAAANLAGTHQSSDFRLTDARTGSTTEACGAKQLSLRSWHFQSEISFTGLAEANHIRTVDVLTRVIESAKPSTITELAEKIRDAVDQHVRGLRGVPNSRKALTVLVSAVEGSKDPRLILISNIDSLIHARYSDAQDTFEISERAADKPLSVMCGAVEAVREEDRRLLRHVVESSLSPAEIRNHLVAINKRAASHATQGQWISPGCMVSSLLRDGTMQSHNEGAVEGVPAQFFDSLNLADLIQKNFRAAPGKKITLVQSAGAGQRPNRPNRPVPMPEGPVRSFAYSVPSSVASMPGNANLKLEANADLVKLRKNEWVSAAFNAISYQIGDARPADMRFQLSNLPTVDGHHPRSWDYLIQTNTAAAERALTIAQVSMAFRSTNLPSPMPLLAAREELLMVAPRDGLRLSMAAGERSASGVIEAQFLLRDFPEIESEQWQATVREWKGKTGRNDPCPCGSGKKFKKCCGFLA